MVAASGGYDLPSFTSFTNFRPGPRKGRRRGRSITTQSAQSSGPVDCGVSGAAKIAFQIYTDGLQTKMIVRYMQGEPMERPSPGLRAKSKATCALKTQRRVHSDVVDTLLPRCMLRCTLPE